MAKRQKRNKVSQAASILAKDSSTQAQKKRASKIMNQARGADTD